MRFCVQSSEEPRNRIDSDHLQEGLRLSSSGEQMPKRTPRRAVYVSRVDVEETAALTSETSSDSPVGVFPGGKADSSKTDPESATPSNVESFQRGQRRQKKRERSLDADDRRLMEDVPPHW